MPPVEADFPVLDSPFSFVLMLDSDLWEPEEELIDTDFVFYIFSQISLKGMAYLAKLNKS